MGEGPELLWYVGEEMDPQGGEEAASLWAKALGRGAETAGKPLSTMGPVGLLGLGEGLGGC